MISLPPTPGRSPFLILRSSWSEGRRIKINRDTIVKDAQHAAGALHHSSAQPSPAPSLGGRAQLPMGAGFRPDSVLWPPRLVHTTAQPPRPLWWPRLSELSETRHLRHARSPACPHPGDARPSQTRTLAGAAPPYSLALPGLASSCFCGQLQELGNPHLFLGTCSCHLPSLALPGVVLGP